MILDPLAQSASTFPSALAYPSRHTPAMPSRNPELQADLQQNRTVYCRLYPVVQLSLEHVLAARKVGHAQEPSALPAIILTHDVPHQNRFSRVETDSHTVQSSQLTCDCMPSGKNSINLFGIPACLTIPSTTSGVSISSRLGPLCCCAAAARY